MLILNADVEVITDHTSPSNQGWTREVTVKTLDHKVRVHIYRDSYDFQSRIYVEVWNPSTLSWNKVRTLVGNDYDHLPSAYTLSFGKDVTEGKRVIYNGTVELVDELIAYAQTILA
jgi:hypothetical protein